MKPKFPDKENLIGGYWTVTNDDPASISALWKLHFEDQGKLTFITKSRLAYQRDWVIRFQDSTIVDIQHLNSPNGLMKVLSCDGYKMKIKIGRWHFSLRKDDVKSTDHIVR